MTRLESILVTTALIAGTSFAYAQLGDTASNKDHSAISGTKSTENKGTMQKEGTRKKGAAANPSEALTGGMQGNAPAADKPNTLRPDQTAKSENQKGSRMGRNAQEYPLR